MLDELTSALESLNELVAAERDFALLLQEICGRVPEVVPGVSEVSVTLVTDPSAPRTVTSTSDLAAQVDAQQYEDAQGPCLEAASTGGPVRAAVAERGASWPAFAAAAAAAGIGSVLSLPLLVDSEFHGTINCYGRGSEPFRDLDVAMLELYVTAVEGALAAERRYRQVKEG